LLLAPETIRIPSRAVSAESRACFSRRFSIGFMGIIIRRSFVLAGIAFLWPYVLQGQCQPISASTKSDTPATQPSATQTSAGKPEFFDEPQFTVAGITDTTSLGGHGSNTVVRTKEGLAKDVASLGSPPAKPQAAPNSSGESSKVPADAVETVREYQRAAEANPTESNFFNWGAELLVHHAIEPAIEVFSKGNRLFPQSGRMLVGLGVAWYAQGSYDQAAQRLCQASDLNAKDPNPYLFLGKIQSVEHAQSQGLVERLERFASLDPQNALANYYYAVSLWKGRKGPEDNETLARSQSLLEKAIHLDPTLGSAYVQLGILDAERKDFAGAMAAYQKAIEVSPEDEEAHYRLAQLYRRTGEKSKAEKEVQIYDALSKKAAEDTERERHEVGQFVYTLRQPGSASPTQ
jgi:tetratricopeptide (TPR) repeat protein